MGTAIEAMGRAIVVAIIVGFLACGVLSAPHVTLQQLNPSMGAATANVWANKAAGTLPDDMAYPNAYFETYDHEKGQPVYTKPHITEVDGADPVHETADDVTKENLLSCHNSSHFPGEIERTSS